MKPFTGTVKKDATTGQVEIIGKWEFYKKNRSNFLKITELPVGTQGDNYKKMLDKMESEGVILDYDNLSDKNGFEFIIKVTFSLVCSRRSTFNTFSVIKLAATLSNL